MPTGKPYKSNEADRLKLTHGLEFGLSLMFIAEAMSIAVNTLKKHCNCSPWGNDAPLGMGSSGGQVILGQPH